MVKVGIVGSGFGLYGLLPSLHSTKGCKVICICGKNTDRLVNYCHGIGLTKIYTDWEKMLNDERLDAIAIAVTPNAQYQIAKVAINKGLHIFAEKPLATNYVQAKELLYLAKKNNIKHAIDFIFPEIEEWKKVKELIENKTYGKLKNVCINWDFLSYDIKNRKSSWKTDVTEGGGALAFYFSHSLYYLEHFAGKIISFESLLSYSKESLNGGEVGVDLLLKFNNNITGYAHLCCNAPGINRHQLIFICEKGTIILENENSYTKNFTIKIYTDNGVKQLSVPQEKSLEYEDERIRIVKRLTTRFIESIKYNKEIVPSFNEGLRVQELIEKIRNQQET